MVNERKVGNDVPDAWNAYVKEDFSLEPAATGRLDGLTFSVKDVFALQGWANTAGNPDWHRSHGPSADNADAVDSLLRHGAKLKGITHTDELMYSLNGENFHFGTPVNPRAPDRLPGGSSSGSAVAAAAALTDFALGTDTGGSVRVPSSYCGVYGIRPTHGAVSVRGVIPLAPVFDTVGWMSRDPGVLLEAGLALLPPPAFPQESGGFSRWLHVKEAWDLAEPEVEAGLLAGMAAFEWPGDRGREWVEAVPGGLAALADSFRAIQGFEIWQTHGEWIGRERPLFGPDIAERFAWAATITPEDYRKHQAAKREVTARVEALIGEDGLLVLPTVPCVAPAKGQSGEAIGRIRSRVMQICCLAGMTGLPQVTIPAGTADGLPVGVSFIAGRGQDVRLLRWVREIAGRAGRSV
ncbi:amidase [Cohnella candidum]|uniref:amidase n=1 Tax=Cohnella candidum TaxID=2674991 RepID=UPI001F152D25|nr:amidase [Cohnella candidum]